MHCFYTGIIHCIPSLENPSQAFTMVVIFHCQILGEAQSGECWHTYSAKAFLIFVNIMVGSGRSVFLFPLNNYSSMFSRLILEMNLFARRDQSGNQITGTWNATIWITCQELFLCTPFKNVSGNSHTICGARALALPGKSQWVKLYICVEIYCLLP